MKEMCKECKTQENQTILTIYKKKINCSPVKISFCYDTFVSSFNFTLTSISIDIGEYKNEFVYGMLVEIESKCYISCVYRVSRVNFCGTYSIFTPFELTFEERIQV